MHEKFLAAVAEAETLTDVNIAAGIALEELQQRRRRTARDLRRICVLAAAAVIVFVLLGDVFAASPVQAAVIPFHVHVFTHLGCPDWSQHGRSVFGHRIRWWHTPGDLRAPGASLS